MNLLAFSGELAMQGLLYSWIVFDDENRAHSSIPRFGVLQPYDMLQFYIPLTP
jgi:hypothetical protein